MERIRSVFTGSRANYIQLFRRFSSLFAVLFYISGIVYFLAIVWKFNNATYISENALSPGVVDETFSLGAFIDEKLAALNNYQRSSSRNNDEIPYEWLEREFRQARLEAYVQNFTVRYPMDIHPGHQGRNVFGVVRAPRGSSTEAVVVVVPYALDTLPAVAVMLALAKFCRDQIYWSKDLFFVVVSEREIGMQAWLNAYHGKEMDKFITADPVSCQSGPIQAAICFEMSGTRRLQDNEIAYNMLNGQLPNLDLFNVAVRLSQKHNIRPSIFGQWEPWGYTSHWDRYVGYLETTARGLASQAISPALGLHTVFGAFNIEAVTVHPKAGTGNYYVDANGVARMLEGILRSVNNLLERFHQSFFFYFLLSPQRYVSIGVYMPAAGLMLLAPLIKALALLGATGDAVKDGSHERKDKDMSSNTLVTIGVFFVAAHSVGLVIRLLPEYAETCLHWTGMERVSEETVLTSLILVAFHGALVVLAAKRLCSATPTTIHVFRCLCLLEMSLAIGVISVLNFGLAFIICLTWTLVLPFMAPSSNWFLYILKVVVLMLVNPFLLLFWVNLATTALDGGFNGGDVMSAALITKKNVVSMIVGGYLHGNWLFSIVASVLYPIWVLFLALLHLPC